MDLFDDSKKLTFKVFLQFFTLGITLSYAAGLLLLNISYYSSWHFVDFSVQNVICYIVAAFILSLHLLTYCLWNTVIPFIELLSKTSRYINIFLKLIFCLFLIFYFIVRVHPPHFHVSGTTLKLMNITCDYAFMLFLLGLYFALPSKKETSQYACHTGGKHLKSTFSSSVVGKRRRVHTICTFMRARMASAKRSILLSRIRTTYLPTVFKYALQTISILFSIVTILETYSLIPAQVGGGVPAPAKILIEYDALPIFESCSGKLSVPTPGLIHPGYIAITSYNFVHQGQDFLILYSPQCHQTLRVSKDVVKSISWTNKME